MQNFCKMNDKLNIDKVFREKLEGLSENPPEYIWENIQAGLAGKRRKKLMGRYGWTAVAAVMLFAFIAGWYFNISSEQEFKQFAETEKTYIDKKADEKQMQTIKLIEEATEKKEVNTEREIMGSEPVQRVAYVRKTEQESIKKTESGITGENRMIVSADTEMIKPIETDRIKIDEKAETLIISEKGESETAERPFSWERKLIQENARNGYADSKTGKGWKLGVNVSPGYSSHSASYGDVYAGNMTSGSKSGNAGVGGGISIQYKTGKKISVESGVYYAQNGQQTGSSPKMFARKAEMYFADAPASLSLVDNYFNTAVDIVENEMVLNSIAGIIEFEEMPKGVELAANLEKSGYYNNSLLTGGELSQVFDFVEVPVYLRYLLIDSKLDVELLGGINAGIVVGNNVFVDNEYGNQYVGKTRDISDLNISGTIGIGLNYNLSKHLSFAVEPRINYYLNSINRNPEVDFRPYRVGVFTGLYYEF